MHEYSLSITDYSHYFFTSFFSSDITTYSKLVIYEEDEWILPENEFLEQIWFLKQGRVKLYKDTESRPRLVKVMEGPILLGEAEIFNHQKSMVGVQAIDDCTCYVVDLKGCREQLVEDVIFLKKICASFGNKLESKVDWLLRNHRVSIRRRVAAFIQFARNKLYFQESIFEQAEYLGVSENDILTVLSDFEKVGMLSRSGTGYHIINESLLQDYAEER